jgi:SAM-dependent methyltransferase
LTSDDAFHRWLAAAEARYLADLTRREVGRALRALSSCYVERREKLATGHALEGRGKRAAFALYYGPLHFLTVRGITRALNQPAQTSLNPFNTHLTSNQPDRTRPNLTKPDETRPIVDVGCGTGAAGAAWALETGAEVRGVDVSAWAVEEANWTYQALGVRGHARRATLGDLRLPSAASTILAAFVINELDARARADALERLLDAAKRGHHVAVIEPIARGVAPWWNDWLIAFEPLGGHARDWRFRVDLPPLLRDLDRSAGHDHRELTARTLLAGPYPRSGSGHASARGRA